VAREPQDPCSCEQERDRGVQREAQDQARRPIGAGANAHALVIGVAMGSLKLGSWTVPPGICGS